MFAKHIHKQLDLYQWSMIQDIYNIKQYTVHWISDKRFGSSFYYFHCIKEQTMLICGKNRSPKTSQANKHMNTDEDIIIKERKYGMCFST